LERKGQSTALAVTLFLSRWIRDKLWNS